MSQNVVAFLTLASAGLVVMVATVLRTHRAAPNLGDYLNGLGYDDNDHRLMDPLITRLWKALKVWASTRAEKVMPRQYMQNLQRQLQQAGMGRRRAGEHLAAQIGLAIAGLLVTPFIPGQGGAVHTLALLLLPVMGFMLPSVRLKRKVTERADAIFKDLPDIVDMLAIAVEAGSGFEAALSMICKNFHSPLTDELSLTLHDMELGLPRKEALQQLRDRCDVDAVRTLVLVLIQADALGIPIGRVLKAQSAEIRNRRRAWAREKAAKLPVKIMFPLVLFIFPPIMGLVIGPAMGSFSKL